MSVTQLKSASAARPVRLRLATRLGMALLAHAQGDAWRTVLTDDRRLVELPLVKSRALLFGFARAIPCRGWANASIERR
jgi:hypothetical protein